MSSRDFEVIRSQGAAGAVRQAVHLELGGLFREALKHGGASVRTLDNGRFSATITRGLGKSELRTGFATHATPEKALLAAIEEARLWGLPDLEVRI